MKLSRIALVVAVVAAAACPTTPAAGSAAQTGPPTITMSDGSEVMLIGGTIRSNPGGWHILSDAAHKPLNLTSVSCNESTGRLSIDFPQSAQVGTFVMGSDETWAGRFTAGPSVLGVPGDINPALLKIRDHNGNVVSCASSALSSPSGNFWIVGFMWPGT